jgi:hypothetical protein
VNPLLQGGGAQTESEEVIRAKEVTLSLILFPLFDRIQKKARKEETKQPMASFPAHSQGS